MAQIDLASATVRIRDGFTLLGAVNNASGYTAGSTSIAIDAFSAALPAGAQVRFTGHDETYVIVSTTGGATPTAMVIYPALVGSLVDNVVITAGPNFIEIVMAEGNLTYEEKQNYEYVRNKRRISFVRTGDEDPTDVSFDALWEYLSSVTGESPTVEDALKKQNQASTWVSSGTDPCEPYCVDIEVDYVPPCDDDDSRERITLKEFRWESLSHDLKAGTIAAKGKCKITAPVKERYGS